MSISSVDMMKCGVCKNKYNEDDHKPKFLQCYHSYCFKCLTSMQETKKKNEDGGGVVVTCPSCKKLTRVGKKGVCLLSDNMYVLTMIATSKAQKDDVYLSDDDDDDDDEEEDDHNGKDKTVDVADDRAMKVWCNTCLKVADAGCSNHDICNLELGKKHLAERLLRELERAGSELDEEVKAREPLLSIMQAAHQAFTSSLVVQLEEEMNTHSVALTVARSELELLNTFRKLVDEEDPTVIVSAINKTEGMLTSSRGRLKAAVKHPALMSSLQMCHVKIQPVLDSFREQSDKSQDLLIDIGGSNSNEEKALVYLMYHILVEKGAKSGTLDESWHVLERSRKAKNKGGQNDQEGSKNQPYNESMSSVRHTNLVYTTATSTESLPAPHSTRFVVNKNLGTLSKGMRCFFDIAINGRMSGRVVIHLRSDVAPKMCANFVALCTGDLGYGYKGSKIFKAIADSHIIGGDFEKNNGFGGRSIYTERLFLAEHCGLRDEKGAVRMKGMGTDEKTGSGLVGSQFHIWVKDRDFKAYTRTLVIGKVVEGLELCKFISNLRTSLNQHGTFVINNDVVIQNCGKL